jgi:hypothetical protein
LQAILFYAPGWLWKIWEGGKLQDAKKALDFGEIREEREEKKKKMVDYLNKNIKTNKCWTSKYFFCEFLALVNVIGTSTVMVVRSQTKTH